MTKQHIEHRSKNSESKDKVIIKKHEKSKQDHEKDENGDSSKKEVQNYVIKEKRKLDKNYSSISVESLKSEENTPKNEKKRDFSEFVGNNSVIEDSNESKHQDKKKKLNKSLNESGKFYNLKLIWFFFFRISYLNLMLFDIKVAIGHSFKISCEIS